jgi:hypothetical protein
MAQWLIKTGSGLDDWIYWQLLLQSSVIIINLQPNPSSLTDEESLHSRSRSTTDFGFTTGLLIQSRGRPIEDIRCPAMDICKSHRARRFLYCYIYSALHSNKIYAIVACVFVATYCRRLYLVKGCLSRICLRGNVFAESLPSTGSICHNILDANIVLSHR